MKKFRALVRVKLDATIKMVVEADSPETACDQIELMVHQGKERIGIINSVPPGAMACEVMHLEEAAAKKCFLEVVK